MNLTNRDGQSVELRTIKAIEWHEDSVAITSDSGWTMGVGNEELDGFTPQVGDCMVVMTYGFSNVAGLIIEGRVIRRKSKAQVEREAKQWSANYRLEQLERYIKHGDELKARVKNLHPKLRERMERFAAEKGEEFWIDSASYEMGALEGSNALLQKVYADFGESGPYDKHIEWIDWWWSLNTEVHGYDYKRQMAELPEFGDGHSGNTAGCAYAIAKRILNNEPV